MRGRIKFRGSTSRDKFAKQEESRKVKDGEEVVQSSGGPCSGLAVRGEEEKEGHKHEREVGRGSRGARGRRTKSPGMKRKEEERRLGGVSAQFCQTVG